MTDIDAQRSNVREQALDWHVRLSAPDAEESDWLAFEDWMGEDANAAAYRKVEGLWMALDPPVADETTMRPGSRRVSRAWGLAIAASTVAILIAGGATFAILRSTATPDATTYAAPADGHHDVVLADGTRLHLNRGARLAVVFRRERRDVRMEGGEVIFDVAHDTARPFLIDAGDRQIRVVGTEFNVVRTADQFSVAVRRGVVEVRRTGDRDAPPIARLAAGWGLQHAAGQEIDRVAAIDADAALAWTQGRLVYLDAPIAQVAADLNRYGERRLSVAPDAEKVRVTATLEIDSQAKMLRRLEAFAPVKVDRVGDAPRLSLRQRGD